MVKIRSLMEPVDFYGTTWIVKTISKEDVKENISLLKYRKYFNELTTDENMAFIADKMSDALQGCYWDALETIVQDMAIEKELEKEKLSK